jgi:isopenicillin N synthase-like dioxygenase
MDSPVPVIDIATFLNGSDQATAPAQVREAATTSGFFQITGHGIPTALFDAVYQVAGALSALPDEAKENLVSPVGHPYRGLRRNFDLTGRFVSEGYTASRFEGPDDALAHGVPAEFADFYSENVWPDIPGFRDAVLTLAERTRILGRSMMRIFALALDLPAGYFDSCVALDSTTSTIRLYPARGEELTEIPTVIFDEHFDGGLLTMLHQRGTYEGLQIRDPAGQWFTVPVNDDAFVINVGELMNRWTNGSWPATRHRVIASSDPAGHRATLPTFFNAAAETVIAPLPGLGEPKFEPVTVAEWQSRHIKKSHAERRHTTSSKQIEEYVARLAGSTQ